MGGATADIHIKFILIQSITDTWNHRTKNVSGCMARPSID